MTGHTRDAIALSKTDNFITGSPGLWNRLVDPSPLVVGADQRRQARLISAFLLIIILIAAVLEAITVALIGDPTYTGYRTTIAVVLLLGILYAISRSKYFQLAAVLTVIVAAAGAFAAAWTEPRSVKSGLLDYLIIAIWLGGLYLSGRGLGLLVLGNLLALLVFPFLVPGITFQDILIGPFSFVLTMSILLFVITRHRNLLERDRRSELADKELRSRRAAARADALLRVAARLNAQLDLEALLGAISEETGRALNTEVSLVTLYEPEVDALRAVAGLGLTPNQIQDLPKVPRAIYDQGVRELGRVNQISDLHAVPDALYAEEFKRLDFRSMIFAAMEYESELIGSLAAVALHSSREFSEDEMLLLRGIADQAALAIVNTRLYKDARRRLEHLQALRAIDMAITANHDLRGTLEVLLDQIMRQLDVDAALFLLLDKDKQLLEYAASRGMQSATLQFTRLRMGEGMAGRAAQERRVIQVADLRTDPQSLVRSPSLAREGFATYFATPLIAQGQVNGVLEVFHRTQLNPNPEWLDFMEALAGQAAIAIENTSLFADLQRSNTELSRAYDSTIEGWSHALDLRDKETEGHTRRVTELTLELARTFGFTEAELVHVRRGALLHDIGKMGVPDRILLKESALSEEEWVTMRRHPAYAHEMLRPIEYLRSAIDIPYNHHEKWDGTGYPRGLRGEEIPLAARIFAVVDVWDALTSDRPYRAGWSRAKTLDHIRAQAGLHFDPQVVEKFVALVQDPEPEDH